MRALFKVLLALNILSIEALSFQMVVDHSNVQAIGQVIQQGDKDLPYEY
ncbi:MAG TPA: hypothetical protein VFK44_01750 [Bacillales bacterium]|nr:hypothetical protein [Bacillales bacterium]